MWCVDLDRGTDFFANITYQPLEADLSTKPKNEGKKEVPGKLSVPFFPATVAGFRGEVDGN